MRYDWLRLVVAIFGILPPIVFVFWMRPSTALLRRLPSWLTWTQSLALVFLYAAIMGSATEAIIWGHRTPSLPIEILLFSALVGLAVIRYQLLWWWITDRRRKRKLTATKGLLDHSKLGKRDPLA